MAGAIQPKAESDAFAWAWGGTREQAFLVPMPRTLCRREAKPIKASSPTAESNSIGPTPMFLGPLFAALESIA